MELNTHLSLDLAVLLLNIKHICKQESQANNNNNKNLCVRIFVEALCWGRVINWGYLHNGMFQLLTHITLCMSRKDILEQQQKNTNTVHSHFSDILEVAKNQLNRQSSEQCRNGGSN